jgi:hypothetical protein
MTDFLIFTEIPVEGKTKQFDVRSVHTNESLGTITEQHDGQIHWRNGWRRYIMHFDKDCDWSVECMSQCYKFIQKLMEERKNDVADTTDTGE